MTLEKENTTHRVKEDNELEEFLQLEQKCREQAGKKGRNRKEH